MKDRFVLDVIVGQRLAILRLLPSEDQALLVRGDAFLVLDLCFHVVDGVRRLDLKRNRLPGERLHEDLHGDS